MKKWISIALLSLLIITGCGNKAIEESQSVSQAKPTVDEKKKIDLKSLSEDKKEDGKLRKDNAMYYLLASNINFDLETVNVYYDQKTSTKSVHYLNFVHPSGETVEGHAEVYQKGPEVVVDVFGPFEESIVLNAKTKKITSRTSEPPLVKERSVPEENPKGNAYPAETDPTQIIEQYTADTPSTEAPSEQNQQNNLGLPTDETLAPSFETPDETYQNQPNVSPNPSTTDDTQLNNGYIE